MLSIGLTRRALLRGGMMLPLMAQRPAQRALPAVDRLTATFVVDGAASAFAQPVRLPGAVVDQPGRSRADFHERLVAEWGLSLVIESELGSERRTVMLDFGYSPEALLNNARLLGIDFGDVDELVLSHGHYDHFGGLNGLLGMGRLRRGVALRVGGEEVFCHRLRGGPQSGLSFGALDRDALRQAGINIHRAPEPELVGHGITTGQIPLGIEHPRTPTTMEPGKNCERTLLDQDKRALDRVEDDSRHELGLAFHVRDHGLVVFGSCSHRGILNTVAAARAASGVERIHAIVGGFHLVPPQTQADARKTAAAMASLKPNIVVPAHCSGEWFIEAAKASMPGKVVRPYVGTRLRFG